MPPSSLASKPSTGQLCQKRSEQASIGWAWVQFSVLVFQAHCFTCAQVKTWVCGKSTHGDDPITEPMKRVNCGGQHSWRYCSCPVYKQKVAIQEVCTLKNSATSRSTWRPILNPPRRAGTNIVAATGRQDGEGIPLSNTLSSQIL